MSDQTQPPKPFMTIAGRWQIHNAVLEKLGMPKRERGMAAGMFFAGFAAALEATNEIAALSEEEAMKVLQGLHREIELVNAAMAAGIVTAGDRTN
jgi:hypothetical protein